jgi:hypothetical protein
VRRNKYDEQRGVSYIDRKGKMKSRPSYAEDVEQVNLMFHFTSFESAIVRLLVLHSSLLTQFAVHC